MLLTLEPRLQQSRRHLLLSPLLAGLLTLLCGGILLVSLSPFAFLARPLRWLKAIHDHRGTLNPPGQPHPPAQIPRPRCGAATRLGTPRCLAHAAGNGARHPTVRERP